jgi:hypothetical protein
MLGQCRKAGRSWWGVVAALSLSVGCTSSRAAAPVGVVSQEETVPVSPVAAARPALGKGVPFTAPDRGFELDKPPGEAWALATNVTSPEGHPIPVVVAHPESGAQIVIQESDPVESPKNLTTMLREKLQSEASLNLSKPEKLSVDSGAEAYGFNFAVKGEAKGRVAVIGVGDQVVLVVASWPENADKGVVQQIDNVVKSVRSPGNTTKAVMRPDKA